jgi:hypothetical protein
LSVVPIATVAPLAADPVSELDSLVSPDCAGALLSCDEELPAGCELLVVLSVRPEPQAAITIAADTPNAVTSVSLADLCTNTSWS